MGADHECIGRGCRQRGLWWHSDNPHHTTLGKCRPDARIRMLDDGNPNWYGDNVGYRGVHKWVRYRLQKPQLCVRCKDRAALDLANISGKYLRDLTDWEWLCRLCHMKSDGRLTEF